MRARVRTLAHACAGVASSVPLLFEGLRSKSLYAQKVYMVATDVATSISYNLF